MNETMRETLSALMDDESNELEFERILSQAGKDEELRRTWTRYAIAQQALHGLQVAHTQWDISARVQQALGGAHAVEPTAPATFKQRFLRPVTSLAVAASVTLTVVVGGRQLALLDSSQPYEQEAPVVATSASPVGMLGARAVQASYGAQVIPVYQQLAQQRLHKYMQQHAEQAALNSPQGLVPFARVPEIRE